jgi:exodeoxyribonuclease VII large subunit
MQDRQANLARRLCKAMQAMQVQQSGRVENVAQHLVLLNPKQVLARGYSLVQDTNGRVVKDAGSLAIDAELRVTFASGWVRTRVQEKGGV